MDSRLRILLIAVAIAVGGWYLFGRKHNDTPTVAYIDPQPPGEGAHRGIEQQIPIHTVGLDANVDTHSGGLRGMWLNEPQFRDLRSHRSMSIATTWLEPAMQLRSNVTFLRNGHNVVPTYLTFVPVRTTDNEVELVAQLPDLEIRRVIHGRGSYAFDVNTTIVNHGEPGRLAYSQSVFHWVLRSDEESKFFRQSWRRSEALCRHNGQLLRQWRDDITKGGEVGATNAEFVGLGNLYFLSAMAAVGPEHPDCLIRSDDGGPSDNPDGSLLRGVLVWHPTQLEHEQSHSYAVVGYFGPKYAQALTAASPALHEAVNLGFFSIIARALLKLLQFLHSLVRNWGLAIIVLTVLVRTALYPITARSTKSMAMMQKLKPEIDALNEKFKDNTEQKGLATMELYRKHKVNPVAGCLPQLAQLPIWWALYSTLQTSVELFHAPFGLWLKDLSAPDPFYILPVVLGGVMFLQQKLMPAAMPDPAQQKMMMYFMPLFMTGISLFLPAGLALYMLVNSGLAMIQQRITKAQIDRMVTATPQTAIQVRPVDESRESTPPKKNGGRRGGRR